MWLQLRESIHSISPVHDIWNLTYTLLVVFGLTAVFFLFSRRMNARLEVPAPRRSSAQANVFVGAAARLRLLPDARTGQRMNFFLLLYVVLLTANFYGAINSIEWYENLLDWRMEATRISGALQVYIVGLVTVAAMLLLLLPLFLVRKNREFYFDVLVLFLGLATTLIKLLICYMRGCCFGVPSHWGIYNEILDTTVLPVQLFEGVCGILAFIGCVLFMLFSRSYRPGRGCAVALLGYAVPRFFWDFFCYRGVEYRLTDSFGLFGLTMTQTFSIVASILAVAWLLWLLPLEKKWMDRFWLLVDRRRAGRRPK